MGDAATVMCRALFDFEGEGGNELSLKAGKNVTVTDASDPEWWCGYYFEAAHATVGLTLPITGSYCNLTIALNGKLVKGFFPASFVQPELSVVMARAEKAESEADATLAAERARVLELECELDEERDQTDQAMERADAAEKRLKEVEQRLEDFKDLQDAEWRTKAAEDFHKAKWRAQREAETRAEKAWTRENELCEVIEEYRVRAYKAEAAQVDLAEKVRLLEVCRRFCSCGS
jgi:hypothetical protein